MKWGAIVVLVAAGCLGADPAVVPDDPDGSDPVCEEQPFNPPSGTDGDAALAWVEQIVYMDDGLRPRAPEDAGHACTVEWLLQALDVPGWEAGQETFTGADYQGIEHKGAAAPWTHACHSDDREALPGLTFDNVYAVKPGGDRLVLLAAHWDAKEDAAGGGRVPAANDGASGMGVLLVLQRVLADVDLPFDVAIAFFDGEDGFEDCHPLAGSLHFSRTETLDVDRMILLDMVGDPEARFPREIASTGADPALVDLIWSTAAEHGLGDHFVDVEKIVVDDHRPFIEDGVPAVDIIDFARGGNGFPPYWHTTEDTPDKLSAEMLGSMLVLIRNVLQDPAFVETWPDAAGA